jgi:hypothetical protein
MVIGFQVSGVRFQDRMSIKGTVQLIAWDTLQARVSIDYIRNLG